MSDNIVQSVASGNAPQPTAEVAKPTDFNQIQADAEAAIDDGSEESVEDQAVDAAVQAGDITKQEAKELKKKLKLKVDGEEFEEEVDWNDEENLKKHLQKSKAFDKRVKEYTGFKGQVDQLLEMLQKDPDSVLEKMGIDLDKRAEERLSRKIEEMKKSPEQLEKEKMEKELEALRKEKKEALDRAEREELEKLKNQQAQQISEEIISALDSAKSILPKNNPEILHAIARNMVLAMNNGYKNVQPKDVIPLVEKQYREQLNALFGSASEDVLEDLIGKPNLDRLRKKRLAARKEAQTVTPKQVQETGIKREEEEKLKQPKRYKDFFTYD